MIYDLRKFKSDPIPVKVKNENVEQVKTFKYLGVGVDTPMYASNYCSYYWLQNNQIAEISKKLVLRLVTCNRLVNLGISKQQHLYLRTKNLI